MSCSRYYFTIKLAPLFCYLFGDQGNVRKLFYDLCKATFTVTVLGNLAPLLGLGTSNWSEVIWFLLLGIALTIGLFYIGFKILNR